MSELVCFFDTETTGFPKWGAPLDLEPHIVQLAASLQSRDGVEFAAFKVLIRPDGWAIPEEVSRIHGITTEQCEAAGLPIGIALALLSQLGKLSTFRVAHNAKFDSRMVDIECERLGRDNPLGSVQCSAQRAAPVVNLPPTQKMLDAGRNHPKTPSLAECVVHLFGEDLVGAHDAMVDVRACARVWWELDRREQVASPKLV